MPDLLIKIDKISVSVIVTTFQRFEYVKRAIKSVLEQSVKCLEIIVVEDASTSGLNEWILEQKQPNLIYVRHETNKGLAAARNTGLNLAKGELIAYLDDDDEWLPNRLEEQIIFYQALSDGTKTNLACIQVGCKILNGLGEVVSIALPVHNGKIKKSIMEIGGVITHSSCFLFTNHALRNVQGFDENLISGIDHDIWMKLAVAGYSSFSIRKPLVFIHIDDRATMMTNTKQRVLGIENYIKKWSPVYHEWFGSKGGSFFSRRYFILVIAGLSGIKFATNFYRDGFFTAKLVFKKAGINFQLWTFAISRILKVYFYHAFPWLRHVKRVFAKSSDIQA